MIIGIGTDIVDVNRILKACEKEHFMNRCFTENEQELFKKKFKSCAGNFAVKEAVAKVLGTGFRNINPIDIEILRDSSGKPYVNLYNNAKIKCDELNIDVIHVSISDTKDYSIAYAIGESLSI